MACQLHLVDLASADHDSHVFKITLSVVPAVEMVSVFEKVDCLYMFSLLAWGDMFLYTLWFAPNLLNNANANRVFSSIWKWNENPCPKTILTFCFLCMLDNIKNTRLQFGWLINIILGSFGCFWSDSYQKPAQLDLRGAKFPGANGLNTFVIYLLNFIFVFCSREPTKKGFSLLSVLKR